MLEYGSHITDWRHQLYVMQRVCKSAAHLRPTFHTGSVFRLPQFPIVGLWLLPWSQFRACACLSCQQSCCTTHKYCMVRVALEPHTLISSIAKDGQFDRSRAQRNGLELTWQKIPCQCDAGRHTV